MSILKKGFISIIAILMLAGVFVQPEAASAAPKAKASNIVKQGKKYLGVRYIYGGSSPKGFDCSGFTSYTFKKQGVSIPRTASAQFNKGKKVSKKNLKAGDLVFFKTSSANKVSHVGIYIGKNQFIHSAGRGVAITSINDPYYWKSRYVGARRVL
ncbi:C40 family peptidase [Lederbergia citrea]|uniref:C40 family peptidase n=1 Tax=Lederbergia citrea TaxID=2833581 RepID=UPI003211C45A